LDNRKGSPLRARDALFCFARRLTLKADRWVNRERYLFVLFVNPNLDKLMKSILFFTTTIVLACGLGSCKSSQKAGAETTDLPANQTLSTAADLIDKHWRLVEIMGQPVTDPENANNEPFIRFKADGTLSGYLGCNRFTGNYATDEPSRIRFSNLSHTMKMCLDMRVEDDLKQALDTSDSYYVTGNQLILNRTKMAPLARFVAIPR
jgi:heat shock protein HslJ